ncbi:hypothetical protein EVAR_16498_1 [Eumeta japonica]|uniref:Uncharacterized protein n=1 Tax=Eumeta variegata TaxID=151549 RepID=A0A4C1ULR5_EUMVA|nr:hypothetical protein EVAR_16498_1 [Eumeta japonica]
MPRPTWLQYKHDPADILILSKRLATFWSVATFKTNILSAKSDWFSVRPMAGIDKFGHVPRHKPKEGRRCSRRVLMRRSLQVDDDQSATLKK